MRRVFFIAILIISLFLVAAIPTGKVLARLVFINKTDMPVNIRLTCPNNIYYFTVEPGSRVFNVKRGTYDVTYWLCGIQKAGEEVDFYTTTRISFPPCGQLPTEPTEKNMLKIWSSSYETYEDYLEQIEDITDFIF